jgi:hypothetical protein
MTEDPAVRRLTGAAVRLERARRQRRAAQEAAVRGSGAPAALDAAILAHRAAQEAREPRRR